MKKYVQTGLLALLCSIGSVSGAWAQNAATAAAAGQAAGMSPPAQARIAPTVQVSGQTLKLNGKGVRYRAFIKVYEIGLYAAAPVQSLEQFLATSGAKRLQLMTLRELTGDALGVAMVQGMQNNVPASERLKLLPHMSQLSKVFGEEPQVATGSVLTIDWVPGRGTVMTLNGVHKGTVVDPLFFSAAARIWLGQKPVDFTLKDALLGVSVKRPESG
ncbi:MAG: chalcone isomerase family protein [Ottowia sp.]